MDIQSVVKIAPKIKIPQLSPGDTVKVSFKIKEGDRERIQNFQGVVTSIKAGTINAAVTVRKVAYGVGIERTFFFHSPVLDNIEVIRRGQARRAKLYYLRGLSGKASRIKEKSRTKLPAELKVEAPAEEPLVVAAAPATTAEAAPTQAAAPAPAPVAATPAPTANAKPAKKTAAKAAAGPAAAPEAKAAPKAEAKAEPKADAPAAPAEATDKK